MRLSWEQELERIFQRVPEYVDLEGTFAVLVGGLERTASTLELACAYKHAADILSEELHQREELWYAANPVLFLYRHAAELALKSPLSEPSGSHNLGTIVALLDRQLRDDFGEGFPGRLRARLQEFATFDKASTAFRYRDKTTWQVQSTSRLTREEVFVPLRNLRLVVEAVIDFCGVICEMTDQLESWRAEHGRE